MPNWTSNFAMTVPVLHELRIFCRAGIGGTDPSEGLCDYTRLVWCVDGKAKGIDVGWFAGGSGFLGVGHGAPSPLTRKIFPPAEWAAVSDQFFATLIAPLNGKANGVWARRFDVTRWPELKLFGIEGAMGMPGFKLDPGQRTTLQFQIYAGPKLYHRLATLSHNEAEVMEFGIFKIVCQALLNALNTLHSFLGNYAAAIFALTVIVKAILWPIQNKATRSAPANVGVLAEDAGAAGKVQGRPDENEPGADEDVQRVRHQPGGRLFADGDPDPNFPRLVYHACARRLSCGTRISSGSMTCRSPTPSLDRPWSGSRFRQRSAVDHGRDQFLDDSSDAQERRPDPAANDDVYPHHLHRILLQLCSGPCFVLYNSEPVDRACSST